MREASVDIATRLLIAIRQADNVRPDDERYEAARKRAREYLAELSRRFEK